MSDQKKPEAKVFSIDEGEWSSEVPGVTRLISLNAKQIKKLKDVTSLIPAQNESAAPVEVKAEVKPAAPKEVTFESLSIFVEHHFKLQGNRFVYSNSVSHSGGELLPWQNSILSKMEIDFKTVKAQGSFHEYPASNKVINEVFASAQPSFIQMARVPVNGDSLVICHSKETLLTKKDSFLSLIEKSQKDSPKDDGKIELDLAS